VKGYLSQLGWAIRDTIGDATPRKTSQFIERLVRGGAEFIGGAAALGAVVASHGAAAPIAGAVKSAVTGALSLGSNMIDTRSIDAMIEDLSVHLSAVECRFLIIVDDLDRLQPAELRQILTLVKTFGNLPNVTHLLAYDREIVNAALGGSASRDLGDDLPGVARHLVKRGAHYRGTQEILKGRRIGSPDGFDSYFRFTISPDQISVADLRRISSHLDDEEYLMQFIEHALETTTPDGTSFAAPLLESLSAIIDRQEAMTPALLKVLLRIGDSVSEKKDEDRGFYLMNNRGRLGTILRTICRHLATDAVQSTLVVALDDPKTGIGTAAMLVAELAGDRGLGPIRKGNAENISSLTREQVEELGRKVSDRIVVMAKYDTLPISSMTYYILGIWSWVAGPKRVRSWVNKKIRRPSEFPNLIFETMMSEVSSSSAPYRYRQLLSEIDEAVFDLSQILRFAKKHLEADEVREDDKPDIERFITGVEQRLKTRESNSA
jgi:hypothetical protein